MVVVPGLWDSPASLPDEPRFMLIDRRPLFLAALAEHVRSMWPQAVIQTTTDSEHGLRLILERPVDVLFCEARATPQSGAQVASEIRERKLRTRVVLIGEPEDHQLLVSGLGCGAAGFFTKDAAPEVFMEGMRAILAGHLVLGPELLSPAVQRLAGTIGLEDRLAQLSKVERQILVLVGQAQTTRAIATSRGITEKTVRNHLANIYRKLRIRNRSEAILWSARAHREASPVPAPAESVASLEIG